MKLIARSSLSILFALTGCAGAPELGDQSQALGLPGSLPPLPARGGTGGAGPATYDVGIIYGMHARSGSYVDQLGFAYYVPSQPDNQLRAGDTTGTIGPFGGTGGSDSGWIYCPTGYAAIGLEGGAGDYVDRIGLVCADLSNTSQQYATTVVGGPGGDAFLDICSSGGLLSGAAFRYGSYVDQIQGLCRDPRDPVAVPDVVGDSRSGADTAIHAAGLTDTVIQQNPYHCTAPFHFDVIDQSPAAGTLVEPGTLVTLTEAADC